MESYWEFFLYGNITVCMKKVPTRQGKPFAKLHGAGNDILVVESKHLPKTAKGAYLKRMAHRQLGVGCDQIVEVLSKKPLSVQIWNGDGTKAEMCANGARVLLFYASQENWFPSKANEIPLKISGKDYVGLRGEGGFEICLGEPNLLGLHPLSLGEDMIPFHEVRVGNPHCVVIVGSGEGEWKLPAGFSLSHYGPRIETHPRFPQKTNVEFVREWRATGKTVKAKVDVWERGAGATLSCGSGAVAVAAVLRQMTGLDRVEVRMTEFILRVRFEGGKAFLGGPSALVLRGTYFPG